MTLAMITEAELLSPLSRGSEGAFGIPAAVKAAFERLPLDAGSPAPLPHGQRFAEGRQHPLSWGRKGAFSVPASVKAASERRQFNTGSPAPLLHIHGFAEGRDHAVPVIYSWLSKRRRDGTLGVPASTEASVDRACAVPSPPSPFMQVRGLAESGEHHVAALVGPLLSHRRPSAILWRVWAVVVNSVDGVLGRRARPHVLKERLKAVSPAVADDNAAPAVVREGLVARGVASLAHTTPCRVFGSVPPVDRVPMCGLPSPSQLALTTSARLRGPVLERLAMALSRASTVAPTEPFRASINRSAFHNDKATESLSGKINPWSTHDSPLEYGCSVSNWSVQRQALWGLL
jgi:hypothetical protein